MDDNDNYVKCFNGNWMWYRNGINAADAQRPNERERARKGRAEIQVLNCIKLKVAMDDDTNTLSVVVSVQLLFLNKIHLGTERKLTESTILIWLFAFGWHRPAVSCASVHKETTALEFYHIKWMAQAKLRRTIKCAFLFCFKWIFVLGSLPFCVALRCFFWNLNKTQ